jgi:hypothetical protein
VTPEIPQLRKNCTHLYFTVAFPYAMELALLVNSGSGTFRPGVDRPLPGAADSVVIADTDGDRRLDILDILAGGCLGTSARVLVLANLGAGRFAEPIDLGIDAAPLSSVPFAARDMDGDGGLDLVVASEATEIVSIFSDRAETLEQGLQRRWSPRRMPDRGERLQQERGARRM